MSKKRARSGGSAGLARWEAGLLAAPFSDEKWRTNICFLTGNTVDDYSHIKVIEGVVKSGIRRLFSIVSKDELFEQVNDLGNPKAKKSKETPAHAEICESVKPYLDNGDEIPLPLLARLIKFKLLQVKAVDLKRRDAEKKAAAEKDKPAKKERGKSPKKGKGAKTPEPPVAKAGSKLKKRGEEDPDAKYIDDEPDDGPQHYILVCGFNQPHLLPALEAIDIHIDSIMKVMSEDYAIFEHPEPAPLPAGVEPPEKDEKTLAAEEEAQQLLDKQKNELKQFWKDVLPIMQSQPNTSKLHDVARMEYIVLNNLLPENIEDSEQKIAFGTAMFEDVACMIYDLLDYKRQYHNYIENLQLIHVPVLGEPAPPPQQPQEGGEKPVETGKAQTPTQAPGGDGAVEVPKDVDMRYYNDLMNAIPQESVSVSLVMHCILEQIQATEEDRDPPSEILPSPRVDCLDPSLASHISDMAFKLALSESEQQALLDVFDKPLDTPAPVKEPLLLNYWDDIVERTNYLKEFHNFNPKEAEKKMLQCLPMSEMVKFDNPSSREAKERSARLQELIHFCATGGLTEAEIDRAFKQFVFECMDLQGVDEEGFVTECGDVSAVPWDDPYPFFRGMVPKEDALSPQNILSAVTVESDAELKRPSPQTSRPTSAASGGSGESGSRPSTPGILRTPVRPASATSKTSAHSVHFDKDDEGNPIPSKLIAQHLDRIEQQQESEPQMTVDESIHEVVDSKKRNLDSWCFAEHFDPHVLLQVLQKASYNLPYVDTYYHKRDHSLLVVLHNPCSTELQNHADWSTELHSNVGFRNYMEHVTEMISGWTKEEEAKYQAKQLTVELDKMQADETAAAARTASAQKKGRAKSPKGKSPRSKSPKSRGSSTERPDSAKSIFIREGSLKAKKMEEDIIRKEEEEAERLKSEKRAKSAQKRAQKDQEAKDAADAGKKKRPGSKGSRAGSARSRKSNEDAVASDTDLQDVEPGKYWPFTGYDSANDLLHASGMVSTLFPADGGQIRIEKVNFVQGESSVKTSIMKDGHIFMLHILDPTDANEDQNKSEEKLTDGTEKADTEKSEKEDKPDADGGNEDIIKADVPITEKPQQPPALSCFGSFSAQLSDGMTLAFSVFGNSGQPPNGKKYEPEPYAAPPPRSPSPGGAKDSPSKGKGKGREKAPTPEPPPQDDELKEEPVVVETSPQPTFQELYITCPDGLSVRYFLESSAGITSNNEEEKHLVIRQSYPFKTANMQECEKARKYPAMEEISRTITRDGSVIKLMANGSTEVLYADGMVAELSGSYPLATGSRPSSPHRQGSAKSRVTSAHESRADSPTKKGGKPGGSRKASGKTDNVVEDTTLENIDKDAKCIFTLPNGEMYSMKPKGKYVPLKPALVFHASDPETKQSMLTREDHVAIVDHPDGTRIVEHADGTRITSYYKQVKVPVKEADSNETGEILSYEVKQIPWIQVECPGYATLQMNLDNGQCITIFGVGTRLYTHTNGTYEIEHHDGGNICVDSEGISTYRPRPNNDMTFTNPNQDHKYVMRHNQEVIFETVDNAGTVFNVKYNGDTNVSTSTETTETGEKIEGKLVVYKQHAPRFFIIHSNGSGTELMRYQDVSEYLSTAENDPGTAVLQENLVNYPGVTGITILKPYQRSPSERWLQTYELSDIVPKGLRSRDLKSLPAKEYKKPGPKFGTNVGNGLAIGSVVKSQPEQLLQCPKVLELRQFVAYKPMSDNLRERLTEGLREYAEFARERLQTSEDLFVKDPRSQEEQTHASNLEALVKPEKVASGTIEGNVSNLFEVATAPPVRSPPPTPRPKRTAADWEQDRREMQEEIEGRNALRSKAIPKYFQSEMGKAFLVSQAPDDASLMKDLMKGSQSHNVGKTSRTDSSNSSDVQRMPLPYNTVDSTQQHNTTVSPATAEMTSSAVRPGNPTPAHASGNGSPSTVRPNNPTPGHATKVVPDRPGNPTPNQGGTPSSFQSPSHLPLQEQPIQEEDGADVAPSAESQLVFTRSLAVDVIGQPRTEAVHVPAYINTNGRPGAQPNKQFAFVEEPVRRHVNTSSIAGATFKGQGQLAALRGFELLPDYVDFGCLREGYTYCFTTLLKNTGVDLCRFKIKQPPPMTGLKVIYNPGSVAAGMKTDLIIEIYAIAVGVRGENGVGHIEHQLEITTETDTMYMLIKAMVMTANEYDNQTPSPLAPGVKLMSRKPPAGQGITRPRKDQRALPGKPLGVFSN